MNRKKHIPQKHFPKTHFSWNLLQGDTYPSSIDSSKSAEKNLRLIAITKLKNNPDLLPFQLGRAKMTFGTHTFLHFIDMNPINDELKSLTKQYLIIKNHLITQKLNPIYEFSLQTIQQHIEYQLTCLKEKYQSMTPYNTRRKRGLINALVGIIKAISGNLDQTDAKRYDAAIEILRNNQSTIIKNLIQEISLTQQILENNKKTFSLIVCNQKMMKKTIKNLQANSSYYFETL